MQSKELERAQQGFDKSCESIKGSIGRPTIYDRSTPNMREFLVVLENVFRHEFAEVTLEANSCSKISDRLRTGEHLLWHRVKGGLPSKLSKKLSRGGFANHPETVFCELAGR